MGGRIYDPTLGRFLQADPFVQAPTYSQSYNRYAYVFNNPLKYTDPSGYSAWTRFRDKILKPAIAIGISIYTGGIASGYGLTWAGFGVAAAGGAASGYVMTGSLKGAVTGAFSGAAFFGVGQYFQGLSNANVAHANKISDLATSYGFSAADAAAIKQLSLSRFVKFGGNFLKASQAAGQIASHAVLGGVIATLSGGKYGHGFFAAGVTKGVGGAFLPSGSNLSSKQVVGGTVVSSKQVVGGTVVSAVIGGTVSQLTGGKFSNGAQTAAFQYLFNQLGRINLHEHEGINGSHTIARHVGKSNQQLLARINESYGIGPFQFGLDEASSFTSIESANSLVSSVLSVNQVAIDLFLESNAKTLVLNEMFKSPTGNVAYRVGGTWYKAGDVRFGEGHGVRVVVRKNDIMTSGFNVHTAFPIRSD